MRVTLQEWINSNCPKIMVRLNGMTIGKVILADEENGLVQVREPEKFIRGMENIPVKTLFGDVQIFMGDSVHV